MRKLTWTAALVGALAWAPGAFAQSTTQEGRDQPGERTKEWTSEQKQRAGEQMEQAGERMQQGEEQRGMGGTPGAMAGSDKKHPLFEGKTNFDIEGKVQKASATSITVTREDLPPATLNIDRNTKVEVDGQVSSARRLRPGQDVKASFNLQGSKVMAVEVKAERAQ